ncbi:MAG TPA: HD domain-containing phosphohydrolase [Nocardioides sp.]|nr:HD domain-containing phosphohydrolase [Nocardioides sp.]
MTRLLGLLGGLSLTMDMGTGAPLEESLRRCVVAVRLARATGCTDDEVRDVLYAALLEHLGCTAYTSELAKVFGDDIQTIRAGFLSNPADKGELLRVFVPHVARATGRSRVRVIAAALSSGREVDSVGPRATCEVARDGATRLGLSDAVRDSLAHVTAMWDGSGYPEVAGDQVPLPIRVVHVASAATSYALLVGPDAGVEAVRRWAGTHLDPGLVEAFSVDLLDDIADLDAHRTVLDLEPDPVRRVDARDLERVARVFGDLADLKSPWLLGHSTGVAELVGAAAECSGLGEETAEQLRLAGHLHDLGRVGVSSRIWDKPGPLSATERAQVELHPWHTEQILARAPELAAVARIAAHHHERLDGSGYHRGVPAAQLPGEARLLAAADRYRSLVESRPHRAAREPDTARSELESDARAGRLDADAVGAVLEAAGHRRAARRPRPAGLTERQVEVLRLVASGRTNRQIAGELTLSPRTVEHHVQDVYARIGVSTRAGAALFAMEHGLLDAKPG